MNYSQITDSLFIGKTPLPKDYPLLAQMGIKLVINMRFERKPYKDPYDTGLQFLWLPSIDSPLLPIPIRLLQKGVSQAVKVIQEGGKVYIHCAGGVHRAVAMGACILIAYGRTAREAMDLIMKHRNKADPKVWYIRRRILRFEETWDAQAGC